MPLSAWQRIPPTTAVRDLYRTSLLAYTDDPRSGVLLRCGAGLEDGSTTIVHATVKRPNVLTMTSVDDDTDIAAQARLLIGDSTVHLVATPHISWQYLGKGLPQRTPIAAVIALLATVLMLMSPMALSVWFALPLAAALGMLAWLLLRERIPTRIGSPDGPPMTASAVVERAMFTFGEHPHVVSSVTRSQQDSHLWAPPVA